MKIYITISVTSYLTIAKILNCWSFTILSLNINYLHEQKIFMHKRDTITQEDKKQVQNKKDHTFYR